MSQLFESACLNNLKTRNTGQETRDKMCSLSLVPKHGEENLRPKTPEVLTKTSNIYTFKHNLKRYYLAQLKLAEIKLYYYHNYYNYHFVNYSIKIVIIIINYHQCYLLVYTILIYRLSYYL